MARKTAAQVTETEQDVPTVEDFDNAQELVPVEGGQDLTKDSVEQVTAAEHIKGAIAALGAAIATSKEHTFAAWLDYGAALYEGRKLFGAKEDLAFGAWVKARGLDRFNDAGATKITPNERTAAMILATASDELRGLVLDQMQRGAKDARSFANKLESLKREAFEAFAAGLTEKQIKRLQNVPNDQDGIKLHMADTLKLAETVCAEWDMVSADSDVDYDIRAGAARHAIVFRESVLKDDRNARLAPSKQIEVGTAAAIKRLGKEETIPFVEMSVNQAATVIFKKVSNHNERMAILRRVMEMVELEVQEAAKAATKAIESQDNDADDAAGEDQD